MRITTFMTVWRLVHASVFFLPGAPCRWERDAPP